MINAAMTPSAGRPQLWSVPSIATVAELAAFLDVSIRHLFWLADPQARLRAAPPGPLRHYVCFWQAKRVAGSARLIEVPKWRLKRVQQTILRRILEQIPVHWRAHGFCRERSIVSCVEPHVDRGVLVRMDLRDFFPSVTRARVRNIFRTAGYPIEVASLLAALCTTAAPDDVWCGFPQYGAVHDRLRHEDMFRRPHLPQGAPTSPAVANLAAYRLDCRLYGFARAWRARYTRYADDLIFSGSSALRRAGREFQATVAAIAEEEGFHVNLRKTRVMRRSTRQSVLGLTLNRHVNFGRREFDQLKAVLHNCATHGPDSQNHAGIGDFRAHLNGRVAYVEHLNPPRGRRLRAIYDRIAW